MYLVDPIILQEVITKIIKCSNQLRNISHRFNIKRVLENVLKFILFSACNIILFAAYSIFSIITTFLITNNLRTSEVSIEL